jgi:copper chaperone CopZ
MKHTLLLLLGLGASLAARAETIEMKVNGLVCGFCAQGVETLLRKHPATSEVIVSLENKMVVVVTRDGASFTNEELTKAINDAGYDLKVIMRTQRTPDEIRKGFTRTAAR